jgi:hypothetical protein
MNRVVSLLCLSLVVSVLAPRQAEAAPKPTVAILGLELKDDGTGIDERSANIARLLTDALRKRARTQTGPFTVAPGSDKELVDAVLLAGCAGADMDCMIQIGGEMATDFLIYGRLEKTGKGNSKGFQVSLTLLDIAKKERVRQLTENIPEKETGPTDLERWGKTLYGRLAGESNKGTLVVSANVASGSVYVDNQPKGNLVQKQARIQGLDAGRIRVRVESDGWVAEDKFVVIEGGDTTELTVNLKKQGGGGDAGGGGRGPGADDGVIGGPGSDDGTTGITISQEGTLSRDRPGGVWRKVFWGSAIVAVGAGGVWGYSFAQYRFLNDPATGSEMCDNQALRDMDSEFDSSCSALKRTYIAGPITLGAAAVAAFSYYMGYMRSDTSNERVSLRKGKRKHPITVAPVVTPDGAGATLSLEW